MPDRGLFAELIVKSRLIIRKNFIFIQLFSRKRTNSQILLFLTYLSQIVQYLNLRNPILDTFEGIRIYPNGSGAGKRSEENHSGS